MNPYILKRLWRRPFISLCGLILAAVLCFLMSWITGYIQQQEQELEQVRTNFQILCVVTNRSGSRSTSLRMTPMELYPLTDETAPLYPHIEDLRLTKEFLGSGSVLGLNKDDILGVTNPRCHGSLDPAMGGQVELYLEDFWEREDKVCLISQEACGKLRAMQEDPETPLEPGTTLRITVEDPYSTEVTVVELTVAGTYAGVGNTIFLPFPAAKALSVELSGRVTCDSAAFVVRDNLRLAELAQAAGENFGPVDPSAGDSGNPRLALTIHDEVYRSTLATLEQNIRRGELTLPLLLILCLACGLLTGFLGTRGEIRAYALMRTIGSTQLKLMVSIIMEQMLLPLLAVFLVALIMKTPVQALLCLLFQLAGCILPTVKAVRTPPTAILREQE